MKYASLILFILLAPVWTIAQTKISKTYPLGNIRRIELNFDYPKLIHVSSWDKKEIAVTATVNINNGKNNSAFTLTENSTAGKIMIGNTLDMAQVPETYYLTVNGLKTRFDSKKDFENYKNDHSGLLSTTSSYIQKDIDITIEVKIPSHISTDVISTYGTVELANYDGPIRIDAKYGGIDATLQEDKIGLITLTDHYGKIYSNLKLKPTKQTEENFFTSIAASPGSGPTYDINAYYGNIYLRKQVK